MRNKIEHNRAKAVEASWEVGHPSFAPSRGASQEPSPANRAPALPTSFEAAQLRLQRAAEQLRVPDQEAEKSKDRVAALIDQMLLSSHQKSIQFNSPINQRVLKEVQSMDIQRLSKMEFMLTLTPQGLAVQYLAWLHESLGTEEPNPLPGWLNELEKDIRVRFPDQGTHKLFRAAERQVFIWVELYVFALLGWTEEFCETLPLLAFAAVSAKLDQNVNRELSLHLLEQRRLLLVWDAVMYTIEEEHLHASVLPIGWRRLLDYEQLRFGLADARASLTELTKERVRKPGKLVEEARAMAKTLLATACSHANITDCHELLFRLAAAHLMLVKCIERWRQLAGLSVHVPRQGDRRPADNEREGACSRSRKRRKLAEGGRNA
jgi:hypothetical protein